MLGAPPDQLPERACCTSLESASLALPTLKSMAHFHLLVCRIATFGFLSIHGLVRTLMPEAWLFQPPTRQQHSRLPTQPLAQRRRPARIWRVLNRLKQPLQNGRKGKQEIPLDFSGIRAL